jgi:alkylation response protein AidB-like acyl-CoA dehydrogenase
MDFTLDLDQEMLRDSLARFLERRYTSLSRAPDPLQPQRWNRAVWQDFAELGLLGLPFDASFGGQAAGPIETMLVMEQFGLARVQEPFFSTVILAGNVVHLAGSDAQKSALLPLVAKSDLTMGLAWAEPQSRYCLFDVDTQARPVGGNWILSGAKVHVLDGASAQKFVVSARTRGDRRQRDGIALFIVDANAPGLSIQRYEAQDGSMACNLVLDAVTAYADAMLGPADGALETLERVAGIAIAALAAESVGLMQAMHDATMEHLKTRKQFGQPLGSFQALQHRAVDMLIALEQARSMAMYAATMVSCEDELLRNRALSAVKLQVGKSARYIGHQAIQMHGGIGMTQAAPVSRYFLRSLVIESLFGDTQHHLTAMAAGAGGDRLLAVG